VHWTVLALNPPEVGKSTAIKTLENRQSFFANFQLQYLLTLGLWVMTAMVS